MIKLEDIIDGCEFYVIEKTVEVHMKDFGLFRIEVLRDVKSGLFRTREYELKENCLWTKIYHPWTSGYSEDQVLRSSLGFFWERFRNK